MMMHDDAMNCFFSAQRSGCVPLRLAICERTVIEWRFYFSMCWLVWVFMPQEAPAGLILPFASLHALIRSNTVPAFAGWPCASSEGALKSTCASLSCTLCSPGAVVSAVCMAYCCLFWFVLCFNERLFLFFYFEKLILNLLSFSATIFSLSCPQLIWKRKLMLLCKKWKKNVCGGGRFVASSFNKCIDKNALDKNALIDKKKC
jgi:hypothetical protein